MDIMWVSGELNFRPLGLILSLLLHGIIILPIFTLAFIIFR